MQRATSMRLLDALGSDQRIIIFDIVQAHHSPKTAKAQLTDWNVYRRQLDDDSTNDDIEACLNEIFGVDDGHTKVIQLDEDNPAIDTHLLHLYWRLGNHF
ncbi:hypothetical protein HPB51_009338 [Rhipicephalus microplus]|uniref:Uncharacterized protein n=1 Tax=Rhipicephalus microplus TaxID=6941 RepID=A0A9J6F038_RHIMP|nr:hypothetical protein HPB51_009338 [Rhipicephalus microplus]